MSLRAPVFVIVLASIVLVGCAPRAPSGPLLERTLERIPRLSLLALGDTGEPPGWNPFSDGQNRVADALAAEDLRRPSDALLFLGDNFYPRGLVASEVEQRVRLNLVRPYCRFASLSGPDSGRVASDCGLAPSTRHVVPLFAVLGNHDHGSAGSAALERYAVPRYVANWRLAGDPIERVELPQGVSLIFFDSTRLRRGGNAAPLAHALRSAQGAFRVLVAHHPLEDDDASRGIADAIAASGTRPQLLLAGHLHSLRAGTPGGAGPALQIVSGGGAGTERSSHHISGERFALAAPGFARVDLVDGPGEPSLRVTLYRVSGWPWLGRANAQPVAVWSVSQSGVVTLDLDRQSATSAISSTSRQMFQGSDE